MHSLYENDTEIDTANGTGLFITTWSIEHDAEPGRTVYPEDIEIISCRLVSIRFGCWIGDRSAAVDMIGEDRVRAFEASAGREWALTEGVAEYEHGHTHDPRPAAPVFRSRRVSLAPLTDALRADEDMSARLHDAARRMGRAIGVEVK